MRPGLANRPTTLEDRRLDLSDRFENAFEDWYDKHQDWHDWVDHHHDWHGGWYHDSWHAHHAWEHLWEEHPVAAAFGLTMWGINRLAYGFGYWGYSNPYATTSVVYDYSQPLVVYADSPGGTASPAEPSIPQDSAPQPTDEGQAAFDAARAAFLAGDYPRALDQINITLKTMPRDSVAHEFRALVLFALGQYAEAAAANYAVLSAGPGWDWTTMVGLYPGVAAYTPQLRKLEDYVKANPQASDAMFLLGYHYQTMGHEEQAGKKFRQALALIPNDKLLQQLARITAPTETDPAPQPPATEPAEIPVEKRLTLEKLAGVWKASNDGADFELKLQDDGRFSWTYSRGRIKQTVQGVYAVDRNHLALEPDAGGTMLAQLDLAGPSQFQFKMIGDDADAPGLQFKKS